MSLVTKVMALLGQLRTDAFNEMSPVERRRFADVCRHAASMAEPRDAPPKAGVLAELKNGRAD